MGALSFAGAEVLLVLELLRRRQNSQLKQGSFHLSLARTRLLQRLVQAFSPVVTADPFAAFPAAAGAAVSAESKGLLGTIAKLDARDASSPAATGASERPR